MLKFPKLLKKLNLDFYVKYVFIFLTVYTIACFISNHINGQSQDTLTQWVFTVFGIELLATMFKKWLDKKYGKDDVNGFNTDSDDFSDYYSLLSASTCESENDTGTAGADKFMG